MSLDKAVLHHKEHRKPYRKSARFDRSCRPGGDCPWCIGSRTHRHRKAEPLELHDDLEPLFDQYDWTDGDWDTVLYAEWEADLLGWK